MAHDCLNPSTCTYAKPLPFNLILLHLAQPETSRCRCREVLRGLSVALGSPTSKFSGAIDPATRKITVSGTVRDDKPFLNRIGAFDVDLALEARF